MNPKDILHLLRKQGIEVTIKGGRLLATPSEQVTEDHINILKKNKPEILQYLQKTHEPPVTMVTHVTMKSAPSTLIGDKCISSGSVYKRYDQPDGSILELTKDDFDAICDVVRMLALPDKKNRKKNHVA